MGNGHLDIIDLEGVQRYLRIIGHYGYKNVFSLIHGISKES